MSNTDARIGEPEIVRDGRGKIKELRVHFGPHHFIQLRIKDQRVQCAIGATHHGIEADASDVPSDFEKLVNELQSRHPEISF